MPKSARSRKAPQIQPESTGCVPHVEEHGDGNLPRPVNTKWVTEEWIEETRNVWSEECGVELTREDAIAILMNVKRLGVVLLEAKRKGDSV